MVDWMFSSHPFFWKRKSPPVISKFVLDACGTSASRQRFSWPAAVHGGLVQLVVLVGFDETLKSKEMLVHENLRSLCEARGTFATMLSRTQVI
jgi:hypothetical protein